MLQEIYGADKRKKGADLILLIVMLLVCILLRAAISALSEYVPTGISTAVVFVIIIGCAYLIYRKRLCEYGYTFYYQEPDPSEVDAFGAPVKLPFEAGTFIASRLVGGKPKVNDLTHLRDILALLAPGEEGAPDKAHKVVMAPGKRAEAYRLVTVVNGRTECWYIRPSEAMAALLGEALEAKRSAENE